MPLEIVQITSPDDPKVERVTEIFAHAFIGTTANSAMFPAGPTPTLMECFLQRERNGLAESHSLQMFCVMDTDANEMVSAGKWSIDEPGARSVPQETKQKLEWPTEVNRAAAEHFSSMNDAAHAKLMGNEKHLSCKVLASSGAHQRRGAASLLMKHAMKQADDAGIRVFLESTVMGRPFYEKLGFVMKGEIPIDFRPYGYDGTAMQFSMVREVGASSVST